MKFKFTWAHGIIVALGSFMIFILSLLFFAGDTGDLITDNYYEKSLTYEDDIDAERRSLELEKHPEVLVQANGFNIVFPEEYKVTNGKIYLLRSNDQNLDVQQDLKLNAKNQQLIPSVKLVKGEYDLALSWEMNGEKYLVKKPLKWNLQ